MSTLTIDYGYLETVARNANNLSKAANNYADHLQKVTGKITNVTGGASNYTNDASYFVSKKVNDLKSKVNEYSSFSKKCESFSENAKKIDEKVAKAIERNQNKFLNKHENLKIAEWKSTLINWLVDLRNSCPLFEMLCTLKDMLQTELDGLMDTIKYWYQCEGGKQVIAFVAAIGGAIIAVLLFIASFPVSGFIALCGMIGAAIAMINAFTNIYTSFKAMKEDDPAWSKIYGDQDKLSDVLRQTNFNNRTLNRLSMAGANFIDGVELFCDVVNIADTIGKIASKFGFIKNFFSSDVGLLSYMKEAQWGKDGKILVDDNGFVKTKFTLRSIWNGTKAYIMNSPIDAHSEQGIRTILHNNFVLDFKDFKGTLNWQSVKDTFKYTVTDGGRITMQDWKNSLKPGSTIDTIRYNLKYNSFKGLMQNGGKWDNARTYIKNIGNTGKSVMDFAQRIESSTLGTSNFSTEFKGYVDKKLQSGTDINKVISKSYNLGQDTVSLIEKNLVFYGAF